MSGMRRFALFTLGVVIAWCVWMMLLGDAIDHAITRHTTQPPAEWDVGAYQDAHRYADWCGGVVTDPFGQQGGPYVVNCDT